VNKEVNSISEFKIRMFFILPSLSSPLGGFRRWKIVVIGFLFRFAA